MRSTAEWEAALEGTTPGPWEAKQYSHEWVVTHTVPAPATTDVGSEDYGNLRYVADVYGEENARLVALSREAVAEVVRLRRELEELRDHYVKRTTSCRERAADATKFFERRNSLRFAHSHTLTHEALTRILEGTHE